MPLAKRFKLRVQNASNISEDAISIGYSIVFHANEEYVALIRNHEAAQLEAYRGPAGLVLIGHGHVSTFKLGTRISLIEAEKHLRKGLQIIEKDISNRLTRSVTYDQFSATVCLAYNIGTGAFSKSTVLKRTNAGDYKATVDAFLMWNKIKTSECYQTSPLLSERREAERAPHLKK